MRLPRLAAAMLAVVALSLTGCSRLVDGTAQANGSRPGTEVTGDGWGIRIGYPDARVQIEFFTEPQCPACAQLQHESGDDLARAVATGDLAVTYRPLTFLDRTGTDYSARVANALFLAVAPATTGAAFQAFVGDLWGHQGPEGSAGPSDAAMAAMATDSGIAAEQADRIAAGTTIIDADQLTDANADLLGSTTFQVGTPTIYNLIDDEVVDHFDPEWLDKLLAARIG